MNNPNPFLPQSSFLEQKNKARARLRIVVLFSISLSVMVLMALLIQGCRKNDTAQAPDQTTAPGPEATSTPSPDTNTTAAPENTTSNLGTVPPPPTEPSNPPAQPPPPPPPVVAEPTTSDYTVVPKDTLDAIAKKFPGVSVKAIENANPGVDPKRLKIGQKLHIPAATSAAPTAATPGAAPDTAAAPGGEQAYKVKSGDTLTGIAKKFHVSIKAIQSANNLKTTSIRVGQTIKIPSKAAPAPEAAPAETASPAPTTTPAMPQPTLAPATSSNH
ncbi:MAG TPA: LysM peptidoglycan-binding domain-containing protein [Verrucomicrobiae bacterium]|nr:LysM peptidoglycan-binding domain-containing protein [Verrucomicrobiae bacterium]